MFENQPKGLFALALANTGERFGYYTMIAVFALFLRSNFGFDPKWAGEIYGDFLMLVYFLPILGGYLADKFGFGKMVTTGIIIMFIGYLLLSIPLGGATAGIVAMLAALLLISLGTGLFKGNLQVMVGNLYDDPRYTWLSTSVRCSLLLQPSRSLSMPRHIWVTPLLVRLITLLSW